MKVRPEIIGIGKVLLAVFGLVRSSSAAPADDGSLPLLTNAQQVIALGVDGARQKPHPVRLRGVVTYPSINIPNRLYVQDETAGIQVAATSLNFQPATGQSVEVEGTAGAGPSYVFINQAQVRLVGTGPLPEPRRVSAVRLAAGEDFAQWVALEATIFDLAVIGSRLVLHAAADDQFFVAHVTCELNQELPVNYRDARVELRGIPWIFYGANDRPSGFRFHVPGTDFVTILRSGHADAFDRPLVTAKELRLVRANQDARVKVSGVVTHYSPAGWLCLEDGTGAIRAEKLDTMLRDDRRGNYVNRPTQSSLRPGDRVELVGAPSSRGAVAPVLLHSEYRIVGHEAPRPGKQLSWAEAVSGQCDGQLVRVKARLLDRGIRRVGSVMDQTLWLKTGDAIIEALFQSEGPALIVAPSNSFVEVTGVCIVEPGELNQTRSFRLHLRDPADVVLLSQAMPWLSTGVLRSVGVGGVLLAAAAAWVGLLRRRVRQRTAELRASAENLRQSEERFGKAFRASSAMLAILDAEEGRYLDVNDAFIKAYGFTREELIGRTSLEIGLWQDPAQRVEAYRLYEQQGCLRDFESRLRTRSGETKVVLQSGDFITIGQRRCILSVGIDITDRKRAEAETLKTLSREKELSELKSSFVSMVSHEFRTPLGVIMSAADVLARYLDRLTPEKREKHLGMIFRATRNLTQLIDEILLLGKVEQGSLRCAPEPVDLASFCRQLTDEVLSATERRCPVECESGSNLDGAHGDAALLRHVLTNLLTNSIKYSETGQPVHFAVERRNGEAVFTVRDRGIGIAEDDQRKLFSSFVRGKNVGQRPGTGLGLMIVKRCVDLHGGTIDLASKAGEGTTVTVTLPMFHSHKSQPTQNP